MSKDKDDKVNIPEEKPKKSKWGFKDAFAMAVRPVRITATHAGRSVKHAFNSVGTYNPTKKEFWSADNYSKDKMIDAFDSFSSASSSALALSIVAGITVVGSPVLGGIAYAGLNTQMKDSESDYEVDKKFDEFMKRFEAKEGSLQDQFMHAVGKPVSVAKESYTDAIKDLREGNYISAGKGLVISSVMGSALKISGLAAMTSVGKAFVLYGGATAATNAVFNKYLLGKKREEREDEIIKQDKKVPYAVINPHGPDAHLLKFAPKPFKR
jgi:hypothetical protein